MSVYKMGSRFYQNALGIPASRPRRRPAITSYGGNGSSLVSQPDAPQDFSGSLDLSGDSNLDTSGTALTGGAAGTILLQNDFSGVPDAATLTLANSAATGQNAFDSVTATGTVVSDSANMLHGKRTITDQTGATAGANSFGWNSAKMGASGTRYFRFYLFVASIPSANITIGRWTVGGTSTLLGSTVLTNTGFLRITNSAGTTIGTMSAVVPTGQWIRVEGSFVSATSTTGSASLSYYTSPESTTATQTVSGSNTNFGTGNIDTVRFGHTQSVANVDLHFADVAIANDAPIGPVSVVSTPQDFTGSVALSGDSALTVTGTPAENGPTGLSGSGTLTPVGKPNLVSSTAPFFGDGTLTSAGKPSPSVSLPLSGSGSLLATGTPAPTGTTPLSGSGGLSATGKPAPNGTVALSGSGALTGTGSPAVPGAVPLNGNSSLTMSGVATTTGFSGTVALSGTGSLTPIGKPALVGATALSGAGTLAPTSKPALIGSTSLSGAGTLGVLGKPALTRTIALSGAGTLTGTGKIGYQGTIALSGFGSLTVFQFIPLRDITIYLVAPVFDWDALLADPAWDVTNVAFSWDAVLLGQAWDAQVADFTWTASVGDFLWDASVNDFLWTAGPPDFD